MCVCVVWCGVVWCGVVWSCCISPCRLTHAGVCSAPNTSADCDRAATAAHLGGAACSTLAGGLAASSAAARTAAGAAARAVRADGAAAFSAKQTAGLAGGLAAGRNEGVCICLRLHEHPFFEHCFLPLLLKSKQARVQARGASGRPAGRAGKRSLTAL